MNKEKTKIYLTCIPFSQGDSVDLIGYALAENGDGLVQHLFSSNIEQCKHDMGFTSNCQHEHYAKCFPAGYKLIWVDNPETSKEWQSALKLNKELKK